MRYGLDTDPKDREEAEAEYARRYWGLRGRWLTFQERYLHEDWRSRVAYSLLQSAAIIIIVYILVNRRR